VTGIRQEVVAGLLQHNELAIENATWLEGREAGRVAALRSILFGHELLTSLGFTIELVPHVTRVVRSPNVADASFTDAVAMWRQSAEYDRAMQLLLSWWPHQAEDKTLGELLKLIPADVAGEVLDHLRRAGFPALPDDGS
jgi:hypothetical protein